MAPSPLAIATSSLQRLVKEEASYHQELEQQQARLKKLETDTPDENHEYMVKQQNTAIQETRKLFPELQKKIQAAADRVERLLDVGGVDDAEAAKAKDAIESAKQALGSSTS